MTTNIKRMLATLQYEDQFEQIARKILKNTPLSAEELILTLEHTDMVERWKKYIKDNRDDI